MKETDTSRSYLLAPVPQPEPEKGVHLSSRFRQEQRGQYVQSLFCESVVPLARVHASVE